MADWVIPTALFIAASILAAFQWLLKSWVENLKESMQHLQKNQEEIDKEVKVIKETYVPKADLRDIKDEIISRLARIEDHLMGKKNV